MKTIFCKYCTCFLYETILKTKDSAIKCQIVNFFGIKQRRTRQVRRIASISIDPARNQQGRNGPHDEKHQEVRG